MKIFYNMNEHDVDDGKPKARWDELYSMVCFLVIILKI